MATTLDAVGREEMQLIRTSRLGLYSALRDASIREHQWGMGQRMQRPVDYDVAVVDCAVSGFGSWFKKAYSVFIQEQGGVGTLPQVVDHEVLHSLLGTAKVRYDGNRVIFDERFFKEGS